MSSERSGGTREVSSQVAADIKHGVRVVTQKGRETSTNTPHESDLNVLGLPGRNLGVDEGVAVSLGVGLYRRDVDVLNVPGKKQSQQEQSETAYVRQGEYGLDPKSVSGYGLRIRTPDQITSKI